ncbi:MAG TPA: FAD binding domain-containing protein [Nocardioides sp.]|jgi:CO/xanthine dehydrogenase FAD-binding subunit|nr:FAD binding domain-containing protein [Nocardioides sp.]
MDFLSPSSLDEALAARAEHPDAVPIMGGTDVMVELNFDRRRPPALLDLTRVPELSTWDRSNGEIRLGAGVSYTRVIDELGSELPGLAMASRTVGSPQIRNRGTVGGNLGAASPAGDAHPALLASFADVELSSPGGVRRVPAHEFYTGVKKHVGRPDELVTAVWVRPASGPQQFSKIGTRNAMVIAVAAFGLALHPEHEQVGTGIGSAGPTPRRATEAEAFLAAELPWQSRGPVPGSVSAEFGRLVATAASPIDDVRGTAAYRLHALSVMAQRCLGWAWTAHRQEAS